MSTEYNRHIRTFSDRIVAAQSPIRILDAIKWDDTVQRAFFASGCKQQPQVDKHYYDKNPLPYDSQRLRDTFHTISDDIVTEMGKSNGAAVLMERMCEEYRQVLHMLDARGTEKFYDLSKKLYGSSSDTFHNGGPDLAKMGELLDESLRNIDERAFLDKDVKNIATPEAVAILQQNLDMLFNDPSERVKVMQSDGIIADAAAGSDYIKLRKDTLFSGRDLRMLESHEGWVHVATTLNGHAQPVCSFLSKGTPSDTVTQEGLAVFVEIVSFRSHPARLRRIADRIRAIDLAEQGATFLDLFEMLISEGRTREEAYTTATRVFRGSCPTMGPFTKDLAYSKGFVLVFNFIRLAVKKGRLDRIPLLFSGKLALQDMGLIAKLADEGLIAPPRYMPPPLQDLNALSTWMAFSNFFNRLDFIQIDENFAHLFE